MGVLSGEIFKTKIKRNSVDIPEPVKSFVKFKEKVKSSFSALV